MANPTLKSIAAIHEAYEKKLASPVEVTRDFLTAAKASKHNAYLTICEDRAIAQAKAADQLLAREGRVPLDRHPLFGIPMGIKDVLTLEGVRTTCGSKILDNYVPPYTATAL